jgi:hypothetical protein
VMPLLVLPKHTLAMCPVNILPDARVARPIYLYDDGTGGVWTKRTLRPYNCGTPIVSMSSFIYASRVYVVPRYRGPQEVVVWKASVFQFSKLEMS